jgi:hypothetical protein
MYSKTAWGGDVEPHILVKFIKETADDDSDPIASMVIFEWKDYDLIGVLPTADSVTVLLFPRNIKSCSWIAAKVRFRRNISAMRK